MEPYDYISFCIFILSMRKAETKGLDHLNVMTFELIPSPVYLKSLEKERCALLAVIFQL